MTKENSKNWAEDETLELIGLYEDRFQALETMSRKKPIYEDIAAQLKEKGHDRNADQVQKKITNLRAQYRNAKPGPTGDETPDWIYYKQMHKILHLRPSQNKKMAKTSEIGIKTKQVSPESQGDVENSDSNLDKTFNQEEEGGETKKEGEEDEEEVKEVKNVKEAKEQSTPGPSGGGSKNKGIKREQDEKDEENDKKKPRKVSQDILKVCNDTLLHMKEESKKMDKEREELKDMNTKYLSVLDRIASSAEKMAGAVDPQE